MNKKERAKPTLVSICIATCKRPEGLRDLLNAISNLRFRDSTNISLEIIVVDNDMHCSAKNVFDMIHQQSAMNMRYIVESRSGIPFARNSALRSISTNSQFVTFIDDDEIPGINWLDELLQVQEEFQADVVTGPVLPIYDKSVPRWIIDGKFFERKRYPTGTVLPIAATSNVMICVETIKSFGLWFNEKSALAGGSDARFFYLAHQKGAKIIWADDAIVQEFVPIQRARVSWILARTWRGSLNYSRLEANYSKSTFIPMTRMIKGLLRIGQGILMMPLFLIGGKVAGLKALKHLVIGLGTFAGLLGFKYDEYKYLHSTE